MAYWQHQTDGINFVRDKDGALLWWGMGSGKSYTSIGIMRDLEAKVILIACPKQVVKTWINEFAKHTSDEFQIIAPLTGTVLKKTLEIKKQLDYKHNTKPKVVIMNYESIWRPGLGHTRDKWKNIKDIGLMRKTPWDLVIADECFIAGTQIDTPSGPVNIQDLQIGDQIYGYDHALGKVVITEVKDTMINSAKKLCSVNGEICTPGHPFYTQDGYKPAGLLEDDTLYKRNEDGQLTGVPAVWGDVDCKADYEMESEQKATGGSQGSFLQPGMLHEMEKERSGDGEAVHRNLGEEDWSTSEVGLHDLRTVFDKRTSAESLAEIKSGTIKNDLLREIMFGNMENGPAGSQSEGLHKRGEREAVSQNEEYLENQSEDSGGCDGKSELSRESFCEKQKTESYEGSCCPTITRIHTAKRREGAWTDGCPRPAFQYCQRTIWSGMENRTYCKELRSEHAKGASLHAGHCEFDTQDCYRGRWAIPSVSMGHGGGQEKESNVGEQRMDNNEVQERGSSERPGSGYTVYNIETGTNNYFVNGILSHNCQKIKSAGSKTSKFFKLLHANSKKRVGLSGTPTPNTPLDIYGIYRFLAPEIFDTSYQRFQMRYAEMGGFENHTIIRYINEKELNEKVYSIANRIETADVVELPDSMDIFVECELSPAARKAYDEFYNEAVIEFSNGVELTAANVLVKNLRLAQIASGTVKDDDGNEHLIDTNKMDLLEELLLSIDEPCVVFTRFRAEVEQIRAMIEGFGAKGEKPKTVCQIASGKDERELFASGEADVCVVNIQAGGVGLNELVRARYGFYYSTGYSSGDFEQSKARIKRPGSDLTKKVFYYHLVAKNTMDEVIRAAIEKKIDIVQTILEDFSRKVVKKAA